MTGIPKASAHRWAVRMRRSIASRPRPMAKPTKAPSAAPRPARPATPIPASPLRLLHGCARRLDRRHPHCRKLLLLDRGRVGQRGAVPAQRRIALSRQPRVLRIDVQCSLRHVQRLRRLDQLAASCIDLCLPVVDVLRLERVEHGLRVHVGDLGACLRVSPSGPHRERAQVRVGRRRDRARRRSAKRLDRGGVEVALGGQDGQLLQRVPRAELALRVHDHPMAGDVGDGSRGPAQVAQGERPDDRREQHDRPPPLEHRDVGGQRVDLSRA